MGFKVVVRKLTDVDLMRDACGFTIGSTSKASLDKMYRCEHSPIRTQLFWVEMYDIPTFVSVHLVRHAIGVNHYVKSNRDDRSSASGVDRNTPVNHAFLANAQALIQMARKRLCTQSHIETRRVFAEIVKQVAEVDEALVHYLVPECDYRGGICYELKPCGRCK